MSIKFFVPFTIILFLFNACGAKYPPSALFPTSPTPIDEEVKNRNLPQDKKTQDKETNHEP